MPPTAAPLASSSSAAAKRGAGETSSDVVDAVHSPASKKLRQDPPPLAEGDDEFDDIGGEIDEAQLLAAAEAAESAAGFASVAGSSQTQPDSGKKVTNGATPPSSASKPKQTLLFGAKPPGSSSSSSSSYPAIVPPSDPSDLLYVERQTMDPAWFQTLEPELSKDYFVRLKQFLQSEEKAGKKTFPPPHLVHSWSRLTPLEKVKVVVVGQDPYHGPGQACGLSFSVPKGVPAPPSLKNIYKEIQNEYPSFRPPSHGCLEEWAKQGVLLLNACLTVSAGNAGSHHGKGWENLTKVVLKTIAENAAKGAKKAGGEATANSRIASMFAKVAKKQKEAAAVTAEAGGDIGAGEQKEKKDDDSTTAAKDKPDVKGGGAEKDDSTCKGVVFMVWGQPAAKTLAEAGITDKSPNTLILRSPHPSPLSAHRGFLGNGHFKKANEWLVKRYGEEGGVEWWRL